MYIIGRKQLFEKNKKIYLQSKCIELRGAREEQEDTTYLRDIHPLLIVGIGNKKELLRHSIYIYTHTQYRRIKEQKRIKMSN